MSVRVAGVARVSAWPADMLRYAKQRSRDDGIRALPSWQPAAWCRATLSIYPEFDDILNDELTSVVKLAALPRAELLALIGLLPALYNPVAASTEIGDLQLLLLHCGQAFVIQMPHF